MPWNSPMMHSPFFRMTQLLAGSPAKNVNPNFS